MGKITQFEEKHKGLILFFRAAGLWLIRHDGKNYILENGSYVFSRILWIIWHLIGIAAGYWVKKMFLGHSRFDTSIFLDISLLLIVFLFVGPIQLYILWRNQQWLPKILPKIKKLEDMWDVDYGSSSDHAETGSVHSSSESLHDAEGCCNKCGTKFNTIVSKITYLVLSITFLIVFGWAAFKESKWDDTKDEYKLVVMMFYLLFPMLTTWLCIKLIDHHALMYQVILKMKASDFKDPKTIRKVSDYMSQMFHIFENMSDHIFQLTLGMNFAIFVVVGIISMFEILQGLFERKTGEVGFSDIFYAVPLSLSLFHIYKTCVASDHLYHHVHRGLFLKLKKLLPDLLMPHEEPSSGKLDDKPFKKVELVYKNLKDWPPKVCVFGGFKVNYQILSGMIFFIFAYARVFIKISTNSSAKGYANGTTVTTLAPLTG
ncbi:unnamed protein product [Meganyctiphanes norvegica]|uniref:Gustatory receptor n=1 Tax=Meganyctiphanes norvegica TaxID=48144 RepID=A0AAV2R2R0_MEGNR